MDRKLIGKDREWIKPTILLIFLIVYSVIIIMVVSDNWNAITNDIHGYIPFGTRTIFAELADIIVRYLLIALVISIIMAIYDGFVYYIWLSLPTPKYRSNLKTYYLVVQAHRLANRLIHKFRLNIVRSEFSSNRNWFPTSNILIRNIFKILFGGLYLIIIPKGIITISSWLIVIIGSFDFVSHIVKHFLGYYFYIIVGYFQSQNNDSSVASVIVILTGVFVLIAFIIKMIYFQNRQTILKINIHETKNNLVENALELHYKAFRIIYKNFLDIRENTETIFDLRNKELDAFLLSISRGELSFDWENGEYRVKRKFKFPPYNPKQEKNKYSFESLNKLRTEVSDSHLDVIMERILYQFHLPISSYENLFWWKDSWEEKVPNSASMPHYAELHKKIIEDKRRYYELDTNELIEQFEFTKSVVDSQVFELINFYFDLIEYINKMSREFGPSIRYFDKLMMSFTDVISKH